MKKPTQTERIADILIRDGKIDNFSTVESRLTLRLAAHIHVLRSKGWVIKSDEQKDKNCVYRLISKPPLETVGDALNIIQKIKEKLPKETTPTLLAVEQDDFRELVGIRWI